MTIKNDSVEVDNVKIVVPDGVEYYLAESEYAAFCNPGAVSDTQIVLLLADKIGIMTITPNAAGAYIQLNNDVGKSLNGVYRDCEKRAREKSGFAHLVIDGHEGFIQGIDTESPSAGLGFYSARALIPFSGDRLLEIRFLLRSSCKDMNTQSTRALLGVDSVSTILSSISFIDSFN